MARHSRFSLFSQPLDRAAFIAYFLGAVIPLAVLVVLTQRYLDETGVQEGASLFRSRWFLLAFIASIAVLSLGSFLALRRTARQALERVERDRQRLAELVRSSRSLASAAHRSDVLRIATEQAASVTGARAAYCIGRRGRGEPSRIHAVGLLADEMYDAHRGELEEAATGAISSLRPVAAELSQPAGLHPIRSATAVPCGREHALLALWGPNADEGKAANTHALSTLSGLAAAALVNVELQAAQRNFFTHVTHLLVGALDSHLGFHTDHSTNVAHLSVRLGRELGLDDGHLQRLHFAALLHDIGMLEIDPALCTDPQVVRKHPEIGAEMLARIALWEDLASLVRHHHEWFDGGGYPAGLRGEDIPYESRIIGLAEAFDSMTSAAGYKPPVALPRALERIEQSAGSQFDPELVRVFVELARRGPLLES